jgi:hypothetical protein
VIAFPGPMVNVSIVIALFIADSLRVASAYGAPPPNSEALRPFHISPPADTLPGSFGPLAYEL